MKFHLDLHWFLLAFHWNFYLISNGFSKNFKLISIFISLTSSNKHFRKRRQTKRFHWFFIKMVLKFPLDIKWIYIGISLKFLLNFTEISYEIPLEFHWNFNSFSISISIRFVLNFQWISIGFSLNSPLEFWIEITIYNFLLNFHFDL